MFGCCTRGGVGGGGWKGVVGVAWQLDVLLGCCELRGLAERVMNPLGLGSTESIMWDAHHSGKLCRRGL